LAHNPRHVITMLALRTAARRGLLPLRATTPILPHIATVRARGFLGEADPLTNTEPVAFRDQFKLEDEALMAKAEARDASIRAEHFALNTAFPAASEAPGGGSKASPDLVRRKRLIYR
jgi:hypothetical protein